VLDFGALSASGNLFLGFDMFYTSHTIGSSFDAKLLFGNTTQGSGGAAPIGPPIGRVPEPGSLALLVFGVAVLSFMRRRRGA
jgi:hypothetical protein